MCGDGVKFDTVFRIMPKHYIVNPFLDFLTMLMLTCNLSTCRSFRFSQENLRFINASRDDRDIDSEIGDIGSRSIDPAAVVDLSSIYHE